MGSEFLGHGAGVDTLKDFGRIKFCDNAAILADQQRRRLALMGMGAGNEGIAAFDLVHEAMGEQEVQRTVDCNRCRPIALQGHALNNVVGANGCVTLRHAGENIAALAGKLAAAPFTGALSPGDQVRGAVAVVMVGIQKSHDVIV